VTENFERDSSRAEGVKLYELLKKNKSSATDYHLISNLTLNQLENGLGYDGKTQETDLMQQTSTKDLDQVSERKRYKSKLKAENKQERPVPLRPEVVDKYINYTLNSQGGQSGTAASIIREMYTVNVDNRIFNNLKQ
jgi:hypothetical protein